MSAALIPSRRVLWMPLGLAWKPASLLVEHCCAAMRMALDHTCDHHPTPFDCPDTVLVYSEPFNEYGIPVRDGGAPYLTLAYCPWCGAGLPVSRRDAWFDEIDRLGLSDAPFEDIAEKFLTSAWRTP